MADADELARISRAHHRQYLAVQSSTADLVGAAWTKHKPLDDLSTSKFLAAVESIVGGALLETAALAVGFMSANDILLGFASELIPSKPQIRGGRSVSEVYRRSVYQARRQIAAGASYDDAMRSGMARARQTAATDVSLANRQAIADAAPGRPWVVGYRRVLTSVSCAFCATASTQRYRTADLHPLHPGCDCDVAEIIGTNDPGRIINRQLLDDLKKAQKNTGAPGNYYDKNAPYVVTADGRVVYPKVETVDGIDRVVAGDPVEIVVADHGELGRVVGRSAPATSSSSKPSAPPAPSTPGKFTANDPAVIRKAQRQNKTPAQVAADENAKAAAKAQRAAADRAATRNLSVDSPDVIAVADRYGVTPAEVLSARPRLDDVKAKVREEAALTQRQALGTLDRYDATKIRRPGSSTGGEYDFLRQLDDRERARLSRQWYSDAASDGPDLIAQSIARADGRFDGSPDEALEHWLDLTRQAEGAGALIRGRIPSAAAYSDALDPNDLIPSVRAQGYDVVRLLGDPLDAAGHVAAVERELLQLDAEQFLGEALNPRLGPPPWQMSYQSWEADVRDLEYRFANDAGTDDDRDRYDELVPRYLDEAGLGFESLYARIIGTANKAGQEVADYARIPW